METAVEILLFAFQYFQIVTREHLYANAKLMEAFFNIYHLNFRRYQTVTSIKSFLNEQFLATSDLIFINELSYRDIKQNWNKPSFCHLSHSHCFVNSTCHPFHVHILRLFINRWLKFMPINAQISVKSQILTCIAQPDF